VLLRASEKTSEVSPKNLKNLTIRESWAPSMSMNVSSNVLYQKDLWNNLRRFARDC